MASCRMLTQLLRIDNIAYALRPVSNFDQVVENYESFMTAEIKTVILINCGAVCHTRLHCIELCTYSFIKLNC
jgi:CDC45-like protein